MSIYMYMYIDEYIFIYIYIYTIGSAALENPNTDHILMILWVLQVLEDYLSYSLVSP